MKRLLLLLLLAVPALLSAATPRRLTGRIENAAGEGVAFATVVLLRASEQAAGTTADSLGRFVLRAEPGRYTLQVRHIAYAPCERETTVAASDSELGAIRLEQTGTSVGEVVVTGNAVRREADRFVMTVGNAPALAGKDGAELLAEAPGVWLDDSGLAINGSKGVKVFIDDRELRLDDDKVAAYLRTLTAADIARVEVIPQGGAEYDADARGGVLRIALRRRAENGVNGSVTVASTQGAHIANYAPSGNVSVHAGRWTLNAGASGLFTTRGEVRYDEERDYPDNATRFAGRSDMDDRSNFGSGRLGAFFDIDPRHSIGAEAEYTAEHHRIPSEAWTQIATHSLKTLAESRYDQRAGERRLTAAFNYRWKIDTAGSALKLLLDYTRQRTDGDNGYDTRFTYNDYRRDTSYRSATAGSYDILSAEADLDKHFAHGLQLRGGLKYTRNALSNDALYEGRTSAGWQPQPAFDFALSYTEQIAAAYASLSAEAGRWNLSAGLRAEYTATDGRGSDVHKSYYGLFPHASVSCAFNTMRTWMLAGQYSRNIERPGFFRLNPARIQFSDFNYQIGNPALRPTYIHRLSLTLIWKYRYTLTVGANLHRDLIREVCRTDPADRDVTYIIPENHHSENHWFVALNAPVQLTKRWNLSVNFVGVKQDIRLTNESPREEHYLMFANLTTGLTLPRGFYVELSYRGQSRLYSGNSEVNPFHTLNAAVKKRLCRDRLTLSLAAYNLNGAGEGYRSTADGLVRRMDGYSAWGARRFKLSATWNFRSGREFRARRIEGAADSERSRLKKNEGQ
ncbi:outer membrane beta-barrel protein [Alistipes sp.]|uniref:outer membrane beta-barrel protein n=1 Tax=Alistipes sp. TaxID=1872444 RepID=UPI003AF1CA39